jgi:anti-sigma factor RsiW
VKDQSHEENRPLNCDGCAEYLQEYVDGNLSRDLALRVFLHVRECPACERTLAQWQEMLAALGQLPRHEPPADFDRRILATVPYASYRAMEPLRRNRVPVYLQESFLPAYVRAGAVRLGGLALAAGIGVAVGVGQLPPLALVGVGLGLLPEALVRLQVLGRFVVLGLRRSEGGS